MAILVSSEPLSETRVLGLALRRAACHSAFKWVNTILSNINGSIVGTYRAVRRKHIVRTLAEFEWRFNHRTHLAAVIPILGQAAVNTCPVTYADLKWADYGE
jgi:hypothetical protein